MKRAFVVSAVLSLVPILAVCWWTAYWMERGCQMTCDEHNREAVLEGSECRCGSVRELPKCSAEPKEGCWP